MNKAFCYLFVCVHQEGDVVILGQDAVSVQRGLDGPGGGGGRGLGGGADDVDC